MTLFGNKDAVSNTAQIWVSGFKKRPNTANKTAFYGNNTTGYRANTTMKVGAFGVAQTSIQKQTNLKVSSIVVGSNGGANYTNNDTVTVGFGTMSVNALFTVTTNTTGGAATLAITNNGVFTLGPNLSPSVATVNKTVVNASANGLLVTIVTAKAYEGSKIPHAGWVVRKEGTGGRAGRVQYEVMIAGGISGASNTNSTNYMG
jgi:hypothetical protein